MTTMVAIRNVRRLAPFFDQALVSGTNFVTGVLLVRALGLEAYGLYALLISYVLFAAMVQQSSIIAPMMTYAPRLDPASRRVYVGTLGLMQAMLAAVSAGILGILTVSSSFLIGRTSGAEITSAVVLYVFFTQVQDFYRRAYYAFGDYVRLLIADITTCFLQMGVIALLAYWHSTSISGAMLVIAGCGAISGAFGVVRFGLSGSRHEFRRLLRENWHMSKWLLPSAVLQWAASNIVMVVGSAQLGTAAAGALRASQNVVAVLNVYFIAIENTLPVRAAIIYGESGKKGLLPHLTKATLIVFGMTAIVILPILIAPIQILHLFYGSGFDNYKLILQGVCVIYLLAGVSICARVGLRTTGRSRGIFTISAVSTLGSCLAVYPLIHQFGINGMVATLLLAQMLLMAGYAFELWKALRGVRR